MALDIVNPLDYPGWDDLLQTSAAGRSNPEPCACSRTPSFFHSAAWARVLHEAYGYKPLYFTEFSGDRLSALIPVMEIRSLLTGTRGVSLPFTDYCEPVVPDGESFEGMMGRLIGHAEKNRWDSVEIRGGVRMPGDIPVSSSYHGHLLDLSRGEENIFSRLRDSTKRNIRKALKEGVKTAFCNSMEAVKEFYRLNCITRKSHGLPPQPFFFSGGSMSMSSPGSSALSSLPRITAQLSAALFTSISAGMRCTSTALPRGAFNT